MKRILLAALASCLFVFTAAADIGPPGTVETKITGVSADNALACYANNLDTEAKELFKLWADLNAKLDAGTLTPEEKMQGSVLAHSDVCFNIIGGIAGTVVLLDGHDYLVDYCAVGYDCVRVIQKSDGIVENQ